MRNLRKVLAITLSIVMITGLVAGCASSPSAPSPSTPSIPTPSAEKKTLNYIIGSGHSRGVMEYVESAYNFFMPEFAKRVEQNTNYKIEWTEAFGTVASLSDGANAIQSGLVEFNFLNLAMISGQLPLHNFVYILPYTTSDPVIATKASRATYEAFPEDLIDPLHDNWNCSLLSICCMPTYQLWTTTPISNVKDLNGKKIGGAGRNLLWFENTGAIPVTSNMTDGYTSMQTKLIEGQLAAASWGMSAHYNEVAPYMTVAGLGALPSVLLCVNDDVLAAMPEDVKAILMDVSKEFESYVAEYAKKANDDGIAKYQAAGGKLSVLTDAQKAEWVSLLPNLPDTAKELGSHGQAILEKYCQELEKMGEPVLREWKFTY